MRLVSQSRSTGVRPSSSMCVQVYADVVRVHACIHEAGVSDLCVCGVGWVGVGGWGSFNFEKILKFTARNRRMAPITFLVTY